MSLPWTILLAIIQGLAEFFPISSSAHLTILGALGGVKEKDALVFFLVLHLGTLLATVVFFWRDLLHIALGIFKGDRRAWRFTGLMALTTAVTGVIGLSLKPFTERMVVSPGIVGCFLLFTAAYLWASKYLTVGAKKEGQITWVDAALVGLAQGLAVLPGISRSGSSITSGLARGLDRETAFRYSFIASLPAIAGAFILEARHSLSAANPHLADDLLGILVSFCVGCMALWLWRKVVIKYGPHVFAPWCLFAGLFGILVALFRHGML